MFKTGDKVKLSGCPFNAHIHEEAIMYQFLMTQIQTIIEVKRVFDEGSSEQWIKTDMMPDWITAQWFHEA